MGQAADRPGHLTAVHPKAKPSVALGAAPPPKKDCMDATLGTVKTSGDGKRKGQQPQVVKCLCSDRSASPGGNGNVLLPDLAGHIPTGVVRDKVKQWESRAQDFESEDWLYKDYPDLGIEILKVTFGGVGPELYIGHTDYP